MDVKGELGGEGASERLGEVAAGLGSLAEQADVRDELIDAWHATDGERFRAALDQIPRPDHFPPVAQCFIVCQIIGASRDLVDTYRWTGSGRELTEDEVEALKSAIIPATGQSTLDFLVSTGAIEHSTQVEIVEGLEKSSVMCLPDGVRPRPPFA